MSARAKVSIEQLELTVEVERPKRKRRRASDTSIAARERVAPRTVQLREQILGLISERARDSRYRGATADEVHVAIAADQHELHDVRRLMEVRRRVSDLHTKLKLIDDTGIRRTNDAGNSMIVWAPAVGGSHAE